MDCKGVAGEFFVSIHFAGFRQKRLSGSGVEFAGGISITLAYSNLLITGCQGKRAEFLRAEANKRVNTWSVTRSEAGEL